MLEQHGMLESGNPSSSSKMEPPVKETVAIDTDPVPPLVVSLKERLQKTRQWADFEPFILSRVLHIVRESHKDLFEPRVVSIGPYHHGKKSLSTMEAYKPCCLIDILQRNPKVGLEMYVEKIRELEEQVRRCYSEMINLTSDEFVEMLLLDGCFLLEFFFKVRAHEPHVLFDVGWGIKTIVTDLILFENQIPFFIVETLYSILTGHDGDRKSLFVLLAPSSDDPNFSTELKIYHLLHYYYLLQIPTRLSPSRCSNRSFSSSSNSARVIPWKVLMSWLNKRHIYMPPVQSIPCATDLCETGVTFKKKVSPSDMFDISFKNGVMEIPTILIDSARKVVYPNLVAFEESYGWNGNCMISYVTLMASLINTKKDVALLMRCGIITTFFDEDELLLFFKQLRNWKSINTSENIFESLFSDVKRYDSRWNKYRAKLKHEYFNNPWSALSVIAAIVLLVLTAIQAIYAMYPIIHQH